MKMRGKGSVYPFETLMLFSSRRVKLYLTSLNFQSNIFIEFTHKHAWTCIYEHAWTCIYEHVWTCIYEHATLLMQKCKFL